MIGGGEGAFIGPVHRMAAELDGEIELVCGAFSSDPDRFRRSGVELYGLDADRSYPSVAALLDGAADEEAELIRAAEVRRGFRDLPTSYHKFHAVA